MKPIHLSLLAMFSGLACANAAIAQGIQQTTTLRAPVTAIALGPSKAKVEINVVNATRTANINRNIVIKKSITAIATPFSNTTIRVGADR